MSRPLSRKGLKYLSLLVVFIFCSLLSAFAGEVTIEGTAVGYENKVISIYVTSDYLSNKKVLIQTKETNEQGDFQFSFDLEFDAIVEIISMRNVGELLVGPNKKYQIEFLQPQEKALKRFANTPIKINILQESGMEANKWLSKFLHEYDEFIGQNSFYFFKDISSGKSYRESRKDKLAVVGMGKRLNPVEDGKIEEQGNYRNALKEFEDRIFVEYAEVMQNNYFINEFIRSSDGILRINAKSKVLELTPILSKNLDFKNPAKAEYFRAYYGDLFSQRTKKNGPIIKDLINKQVDFTPLDSLISGMSGLEDENLRRILFIDQIQEIFFNPNWNQNAMYGYLLTLEKDENPFVNQFATNVISKVLKGRKGYEIEDFKLLNERNEFVTLEELKGKFIYVGFYAHWCRNCEEELGIIENLKKEYGKDIEFVSICMDDDYSLYKDYLIHHKKQDWHFLFGASDPKITEKFNVKNLPSYFLLDPEGKIYMDYTKGPSEEVHRDFETIKVALKKQSYKPQERIKVWDD